MPTGDVSITFRARRTAPEKALTVELNIAPGDAVMLVITDGPFRRVKGKAMLGLTRFEAAERPFVTLWGGLSYLGLTPR